MYIYNHNLSYNHKLKLQKIVKKNIFFSKMVFYILLKSCKKIFKNTLKLLEKISDYL